MKKPFLGGNWKMQGDLALVHSLLPLLAVESSSIETVVFPAYPYLTAAIQELKSHKIQVGAQNCSSYLKGAYTGEVSVSMLADLACPWVLIGHSERRHQFGETDDMLQKKLRLALAEGLQAVYCVGETEAERLSGQTEYVILRQLACILPLLTEKVVIAYEPVWAIGTGRIPTLAEITDTHTHIRSAIAKQHPELAKILRILYGGSLKPENAAAIFALPEVDGGLVGGASLEANSFIQLMRQLREAKCKSY